MLSVKRCNVRAAPKELETFERELQKGDEVILQGLTVAPRPLSFMFQATVSSLSSLTLYCI